MPVPTRAQQRGLLLLLTILVLFVLARLIWG
jgi:hypothetical protein